MSASYRVTCIKRGPPDATPAQAIVAVGGTEGPSHPPEHRMAAPSGQPWTKSAEEAMRDIRAGTCTYYVSLGLRPVSLVIGQDGGTDYLKTAFDAELPVILLDLPDCAAVPG